jgi:hypothetical protein
MTHRTSGRSVVTAVAGLIALFAGACADGLGPTMPTRPAAGVSPASSSQTPTVSGSPTNVMAVTSTDHNSVPVAFDFASGTCGLATHVAATGQYDIKVHSVTTPGGTVRVTLNSQARGTATGDDGSRYVFSYNQTLIQENAATDPIPVRATDVFQLVGLGGAPSVHTGFVVTADLSGGQLSNVTFTIVRGNPFACDPL